MTISEKLFLLGLVLIFLGTQSWEGEEE